VLSFPQRETLSEAESDTLDWALAGMRGFPPREGEIERFVSSEWRNKDSLVHNFSLWGARVGTFEEREVRKAPDCLLEVSLSDSRDRLWSLRLRLDPENRIAGSSVFRPVPAGFSIRPANDSDWKALAELERSCPTQTSDGGSASIDRGETLEAHFELQGEYAIWIAEYEGKLVGARGLTVREAVLDGVPRRLCYSHFVRVLPAFQSQGLFQPLNAMALEGLQRSTDGIFAYMDPRNDAMRAAIGGSAAGGGWTVHAQRLAIRCSDHAIAGDARRASPSDAARVVGLVNASHGSEAFFSKYSERSLFQRLSRVPEAYSWSDLLVGEHAVAGLWNSAERRRTERAGVVRQSIRSPILDYGFEGEAGLDELVGLLGQWCHAALETGTTHLTLFSSKPSPGWGRLSALAEEIEAYEFPCFLPPPEDLEQRGLYVDAVFF
jgi:hypothetical protein